MSAGWKGVRKGDPCPACEGLDRCAWSPDGTLLHCFRTRVAPAGMKWIKDGFDPRGAHFAREDAQTRVHGYEPRTSTPSPNGHKVESGVDPAVVAAEHPRLHGQMDADTLRKLAANLEVAEHALEDIEAGLATETDIKRIEVGFAAGTRVTRAAVFPERNGKRELVGIGFRAGDGRKGFAKGQLRGLVIPKSFEPGTDKPLLIVEGPSDVAAVLTAGAMAIGRPSNNGGAEHLIELLRDCTNVLVVAENDQREKDGKLLWPGRDGAVKVATELARAWRKPVRWALPPVGVKDMRDLLRLHAWTSPAEFLRALEARVETVEPPATWPEPMDEAAFYGIAGEFVRMLEPHTEADPVALLIQFLAAFGSMIGRGAHFTVESDEHHANIFAVLVGRSSRARKGTALGRVRAVFQHVDETWERDRIQSGLSSGEGLIWAVRDAIMKKVPPRRGQGGEPIEVEVDPGVKDKRLLLVESEFASVLRVLERDGNTLSAVIRNSWDRGNLRALTKNSPASATGAHVSIIGHVTRDEVLRYLTRTEAGNGFGNRFAWFCVARSKNLPLGGNLDPTEIDKLAARVAELADCARHVGDVCFDHDARDLWCTSLYRELTREVPGMVGSMTARAEAQVLRFALIYSQLDGENLIRLPHLRAGAAVWRYSYNSARFIFGDVAGDPAPESAEDRARRVLVAWIEQRGGEASPSDLLAQGPRPRPKTVVEAERLLNELALAGLGAFKFKAGPKTGARSPRVFRLGSGSPRDPSRVENGACASTSTPSDVHGDPPRVGRRATESVRGVRLAAPSHSPSGAENGLVVGAATRLL